MICNSLEHGTCYETNQIETTETQISFDLADCFRFFLNRFVTSKKRYVFVARSACAGCLMNVLLSPLNGPCCRVNAFTFEGWSLIIAARILNPIFTK